MERKFRNSYKTKHLDKNGFLPMIEELERKE
jgi:hypothetical protein